MAQSTDSSLNIRRLILVPAVITLAITLLRLAGELAHWSPRLFSTAPGGGMAVVGISWLPFIFGPYFAITLAKSGHSGSGIWKTFGLSMAGLLILIAGLYVGFSQHFRMPGKQALGILLIVLAPALVTLGWPALFKVLVAYAYAARIPVAIVMLFALHGHWGTHYDAVSPNYTGPASFFGRYMLIAFLPQMVMWIAFTVVVGALIGSLLTGLVYHPKPAHSTV